MHEGRVRRGAGAHILCVWPPRSYRPKCARKRNMNMKSKVTEPKETEQKEAAFETPSTVGTACCNLTKDVSARKRDRKILEIHRPDISRK
eukprot:16445703-Heterocapsa_arctica.AAC.1